jgi:hypothetical protein
MSGNDPTLGDGHKPKGFDGLGNLSAKPTPPAPPPPQAGATPVSTKGGPGQSIEPSISSGTPVTTPPTQGTSRGTVIWWLVVLPAIIFGAIAMLSNNRPTTSLNQQDVQKSNVPQAPSAPAPQPAYIATVLANIRATASPRAAVVAQLPQWTEISVSGVDGAWSHIVFTSPTGAGEGYVLNRLLQPGSAQDARVAYCEVATTVRPSSGEVLLQVGTGSHSIKVNAGASDALIKLRQNGKTELAFFVRANETGEVANLADGTYQIMFATGGGFSRKCLEFVNSMRVSTDPTPTTFQTWQEPTESGVMVHSSAAEYTLTQQVGGNFTPQDLDPSAFRE